MTASVLILGGTGDIGHFSALALREAAHRVTVLNRGVTADELPPDVERLRADRSDSTSLQAALAGRDFDLVLDTTTYNGDDARQAVELFAGRTGRYVFISSGQVYLVREGATRPFREEDYPGRVIAAPAHDSPDYESWLYGVEKREAEDVFAVAWTTRRFPVTTLRLPMVASERDRRGRVQAYMARLLDGGPLLVPDEPGLPLRHVYVRDVANLVAALVSSGAGIGRTYNVSWGKSVELEEFIALLASLMRRPVRIAQAPRVELERCALLPDCSPFSGRWMSELDPSRSVRELHADPIYTAPEEYMLHLVADYEHRWQSRSLIPAGYARRTEEIAFAEGMR
ncbi:MAG TPA: NAD-dependent epimerase/dehydratase family protein [Gemmatimonadaceae bacterium]|nr:NAD-dependent epimerase/dehydratase family protein [Gemmatimonadaceae bacterium]